MNKKIKELAKLLATNMKNNNFTLASKYLKEVKERIGEFKNHEDYNHAVYWLNEYSRIIKENKIDWYTIPNYKVGI